MFACVISACLLAVKCSMLAPRLLSAKHTQVCFKGFKGLEDKCMCVCVCAFVYFRERSLILRNVCLYLYKHLCFPMVYNFGRGVGTGGYSGERFWPTGGSMSATVSATCERHLRAYTFAHMFGRNCRVWGK